MPINPNPEQFSEFIDEPFRPYNHYANENALDNLKRALQTDETIVVNAPADDHDYQKHL